MSERLVIVTGAAGGIGSAVCELARADGWRVIGLDRRDGPNVDATSDLSSDSTARAAISDALSTSGLQTAGLVNAAGFGFQEDFLATSDESWADVLEANLMTTVRLCRVVIPWMLDSAGSGSIVNFGSQAGKSGGITIGAHYSAAKAAVMCLTKTLAGTYGPRGIRVNAVAPGIIETSFLDAVPAVRSMTDRIPLRRLGEPSDAAGAVMFLLGDRSRYITGEILDVNGGLLMD